MTIEEKITEDVKTAMKAGDKLVVNTLRNLRAQIKDFRIEKQSDLTDEDVRKVLTSAAKKRRESIEMYRQGNRQDLVDAESAELEIIQRYLPRQMSDEEVQAVVDEVIASSGATGEKDMGRVMGAIMPRVKGKADGKVIQTKVREALARLSQ